MQLQHQGNHRNGAIKHIFYTNQIHGGIISRLFFIPLGRSTLALHLAVKILSNLSVWRFEHRLPYIHLSVVSKIFRAGLHFVTQPILLSENIPTIWHKLSTKHKEVRPDWNDKNDNAKLRALVSHGRFYQWLRLPFKEIFDQVRKDLDCELFYSELKRHNVSHYIYYLATDNIHIVLETITPC